MTSLAIRPATAADLPRAHALIERAYRGDSARAGWTHEADLLDGARTDLPTLAAIVGDPAQHLLLAERDGVTLGCVNVADRGHGLAYLGLLCVEPGLQGGGIGDALMKATEARARADFTATRIEMTVIERRRELIAYYERRGYGATGERRPFPVPDQPFDLIVLEKPLS